MKIYEEALMETEVGEEVTDENYILDQLDHWNIIEILDEGKELYENKSEKIKRDVFFTAFELIEGSNLEDFIKRFGGMEENEG